MASTNEDSVPVINFGSFLNGSEDQKQAVSAQMKDAFQNIGFVCLTNHGVPQNKLQECFQWSKRFFDLPLETKMLAPHPPGGSHHRGYSGIGQEKVSQQIFDRDAIHELRKVPDTKESFESGNVKDDLQPNIWPPENKLPGFRRFVPSYIHVESCQMLRPASFMEDFYVECAGLVRHVFSAVALSLSLPHTYFHQFHSREFYQFRLLHYPSISEEALLSGEKGRLSAHTDYGTLTLLFQDQTGGLEVEHPHRPGHFMPVKPLEGAVLINIADCLMRWSNDSLKSTMHRVKAPPVGYGSTSNGTDGERMTNARYSIVYFAAANPDVVVDALPGTWNEQQPKKYEPVTAREYFLKRVEASY
ncbi:MAG: hypothetical protein M1822_008830 [Bathelium mastoideum]|nr:MAG: hypothetical protein M1822_008830 [Bathelium mastoideum]